MKRKFRIPFNILDKRVFLKPFDTELEKNALILQELQDSDPEYCIDETLRLFGFEEDNFSLSEITHKEKILLLYLYRGISVGDEQNITFTCSCGALSNSSVVFDFNKGEIPKGIKFLDKELTDYNVDEFLTKEYLEELNVSTSEDLDIQKYEEVLEDIKKAQEQISFISEARCSSCHKVTQIDCSGQSFALEHLSEEDLLLIYQGITVLVDVGYTLSDVYQLLPFERSVLTDQMTQHLEEKSQ